ncbi:MAG: hypothetical protein ABI992_00925 [Chthoniobacterales bacterium]
MKTPSLIRFLALGFAISVAGGSPSAWASDHADPLVLNPLNPPKEREPRITDLHVFLDSDALPPDAAGKRPTPQALIISFCVFPSIPPLARADEPSGPGIVTLPLPHGPLAGSAPYQLPKFDLVPYTYRIFLDLHAKLSFENAGDRDRYGGTVLTPGDITPEVMLEFHLKNDATIGSHTFSGFDRESVPQIKLTSGVFDDPFIFPRFFRTNVVGMVVSIPLHCFPAGQREFLVWATASRDGKEIDHVGRSQRTQLPRFDYLNTLPPNEHVAAINRHHEQPSLGWDLMRTFLSPLFARRPYDAAPDVLIFRFGDGLETKFPNGRKLTDDVAAIIKETGDTQLWEAANTDDTRYPRSTLNDGDFEMQNGQRVEVSRKPFGSTFPYLASPWTKDEVEAYPLPFPGLGRPNLANSSWHTLWLAEFALIAVLVLALCLTVRGTLTRVFFVLVALGAFWMLQSVAAPNLTARDPGGMDQPARKLRAVALGGGLVVLLGFGLVYALGRRRGFRLSPPPYLYPEDREGPIDDDSYSVGASYQEIHDAVFAKPYYKVWGAPDEAPLPLYRQSVARMLRGLFRIGVNVAMFTAAQRTLRSRADLRWGPDRKGFRRLVHPVGVCLSGRWEIDDSVAGTAYTGYFAKGQVGRVIARYSLGGNDPRSGHNRSHGLIGKIFPMADSADGMTPRAHFVTQEDLGGTLTNSIIEVLLTNSPPVTFLKRGSGLFAFLVVVVSLFRADRQPAERQLYEVAELGERRDRPTSCPRFMRLRIAGLQPPQEKRQIDFREEILDLIYDREEIGAKRELVLDIEVSEKGWRTIFQRIKGQEWMRIGCLTFDQAVASYNGDFVIHFHHPVWRKNRNDPGSVARKDLRA